MTRATKDVVDAGRRAFIWRRGNKQQKVIQFHFSKGRDYGTERKGLQGRKERTANAHATDHLDPSVCEPFRFQTSREPHHTAVGGFCRKQTPSSASERVRFHFIQRCSRSNNLIEFVQKWEASKLRSPRDRRDTRRDAHAKTVFHSGNRCDHSCRH